MVALPVKFIDCTENQMQLKDAFDALSALSELLSCIQL